MINPIADVRMHGFRVRSEVPVVLDWIDQHAARLGAESVPLEEACGRTLAAEVIAPLDVPGFDRAAMDGFAVRGGETAGASEYNPLEFGVRGQAMPGQPFAGNLPPRSAVRIMPPNRCDAGQVNQLLRVEFSADFVFYRPKADA